MQRTLLYFFLLLLSTQAFSQFNLVPNPSFELLGSATNPSFPVQNWDRPPGSITTPDAFHASYSQGYDCVNDRGVPHNGIVYSYPKSGNGYVGFLNFYNQGGQTNGREYIQVQLISPLQAGVSYRVGFFAKKAPHCRYAIDHLGLYISDTAISQPGNQPINVIPQLDLTSTLYDTMNWTLHQIIYPAHGGESYITIGNFYPDSACNIPYIWQTDTVCWFNRYGAYYLIDSVYVFSAEPSSIEETSIQAFNIYPNPADDWLNLHISSETTLPKTLTLYEAMGRKIVETSFIESDKQFDIADLPKGYYYLQLQIGDKKYYQRFCKGE